MNIKKIIGYILAMFGGFFISMAFNDFKSLWALAGILFFIFSYDLITNIKHEGCK